MISYRRKGSLDVKRIANAQFKKHQHHIGLCYHRRERWRRAANRSNPSALSPPVAEFALRERDRLRRISETPLVAAAENEGLSLTKKWHRLRISVHVLPSAIEKEVVVPLAVT